MNYDDILDAAIAIAADDWPRFEATMPSNLTLRDKVTFFAQRMKPVLVKRFPELVAAAD